MFSIVVPTRGDVSRLEPLLVALEAQTFPLERIELVLVIDEDVPDEMKPDMHRRLMKRIEGLHGSLARLVPSGGPGAPRNAGAGFANHDWLAFTQEDCLPAPDWLARAAERISRAPEPDVLEGLTLSAGGRPPRRRGKADLSYDPGNLFVRRERFQRVRGYHPGFHDEERGIDSRGGADFGFALEESNAVAVRDDSVRVTRPARYEGFWEPLRWAAAHEMDALLARRHPRLFRERFDVHRIGPIRLRRPIVRACTGVVLALVLAAALVAAGRGLQAVPLLAIAVLLELVVWSRWRFHPLRLLPVLLVPFAVTLALLRGQARAARFSVEEPATRH